MIVGWRRHARLCAERVLADSRHLGTYNAEELASKLIESHLTWFGIPRNEWVPALRNMMLELRGWAGMFARMQARPDEAPEAVRGCVRLLEFAAVQVVLMRASIEALALESGWHKAVTPFSMWIAQWPPTQRAPSSVWVSHPSSIASVGQQADSRDELESQFERTLLHSIGSRLGPLQKSERPSMQLITCIGTGGIAWLLCCFISYFVAF